MDNILRSTGTEYLLKQGLNKSMPQNKQSWDDTKSSIGKWWKKKTLPMPEKYRNAPPPPKWQEQTKTSLPGRVVETVDTAKTWGSENFPKIAILAVAMVGLIILGILALKK